MAEVLIATRAVKPDETFLQRVKNYWQTDPYEKGKQLFNWESNRAVRLSLVCMVLQGYFGRSHMFGLVCADKYANLSFYGDLDRNNSFKIVSARDEQGQTVLTLNHPSHGAFGSVNPAGEDMSYKVGPMQGGWFGYEVPVADTAKVYLGALVKRGKRQYVAQMVDRHKDFLIHDLAKLVYATLEIDKVAL